MKKMMFILLVGLSASCSVQPDDFPAPTSDSMMVRFWNFYDGSPGDSVWMKNSLKSTDRYFTSPLGLGFTMNEWTVEGAVIDYYQIGVDSITIYRINPLVRISSIVSPPASGRIIVQ